MNEPPPIPPNRTPPPTPHLRHQQGHSEHPETPIHPAILATALLVIAIIALIIGWLLFTITRSVSSMTENNSQDTSQVSSIASTEVDLGTGKEQDTNGPNDADSSEDSEDTSNAPQPQTPSEAAEEGDQETNPPPLGDTAIESIADGDTESPRLRPFNAGSSKRISTNGTNPFLIGTETSSTVFVIDKSSSMDGTAFESVQNSLLQAIKSLNSSQRFSVIFFDDGPRVMPPNQKVNADEQGKAIANDFIKKMAPSGGTNPYSATRMALDMNPDSVVVLSDGAFDITEVEMITQENQMNNKTPIHCIGLQARIRTLQKLAEDNSGTYRTAIAPR